MKIAALLAIMSVLPCSGQGSDMLRFRNGDQLHGDFSGIAKNSTIRWERDDVGGGVEFSPAEIRQVVLRGGRPAVSLQGFSHIGTVNGDRIPGVIRDLDSKRLLLETEFGGLLEIPRSRVGLLAPSPLGGRVLYNGPFAADDWSMVSTEHPDGLPIDKDGAPKEAKTPVWKYSSAAWYWDNQNIGTALIKKSGVPDRALIRFDIAWKNRLSLGVAFHSDFSQMKMNAGEGDKVAADQAAQPTSIPGLFGRSYVLHLYSNYVMLYRTTLDEEGRPRPEQVRANNTSVRMGDSGNASIELRCNRISGEIVLFIDGEFVAQWSEQNLGEDEANGYAGAGDGMGFVVQSEESPVRISEIMIAEWNGMPDAARSLQVDDSDIVLLSNGTDRMAGKVTTVHDGKLTLESRYGDFVFPMEEIAEVRFAKSQLEKSEDLSGDSLIVRLYPIGRISGKALGGDDKNLLFLNAAAGEIDLNLDSAVMLEFEPSGSFLDDWDVDF